MADNQFFAPRPQINPTIYAYELVDVPSHKGYIKVGFTERNVKSRIKERCTPAVCNTRFYSVIPLCAPTVPALPTTMFTVF